jgi:hypothetical protein
MMTLCLLDYLIIFFRSNSVPGPDHGKNEDGHAAPSPLYRPIADDAPQVSQRAAIAGTLDEFLEKILLSPSTSDVN